MKPSPDGQYMYVANTGSRSIMSIRTNDNTVAATRGLGSSPFDITVLPSGEFIYVACWDSGMVAVVRASDFTVVAKAHLFSYAWGIAAMPDGHHVYVGNNLFDFEGTAVIRTSDNQVVADVSTDGEAHGGIVPLPNGSKVYVGSGQFGSSVSVIGRQLLAAPLSGVSAPRRLEASPVTRGRPRPPLSAVFGSRQTAGSTHGERGKSRTPASKPRIGD